MTTNKEAKYRVGQSVFYLEDSKICEGHIMNCEYVERRENEWFIRYRVVPNLEPLPRGFWCRETHIYESKEALKKYINKQ